jgi:hypothetical protein
MTFPAGVLRVKSGSGIQKTYEDKRREGGRRIETAHDMMNLSKE